MRRVNVKKLVGCLSDQDKRKLDQYISNKDTSDVKECIFCQSISTMMENRIKCLRYITVPSEVDLKVLADYVIKKKDKIDIQFNTIRPDVLKYLESDSVKYKPIIEAYSYALPMTIGLWTKCE